MLKFVIVFAALVASACASGYRNQAYGNQAYGYDALRVQYKPRAVVEYLPLYSVPSHGGYSGAVQAGYVGAQDGNQGDYGSTQQVSQPSAAAASSAVAKQDSGIYGKNY